ncbi:MAG TPA: Ig-like domain-containing protein, partial [Vicinamibacterales bacterium]|nr:Ig-like domain-containing protein [Vicinamibacterales bacterium]
ARARDAAGNTTTSAPVTVTVSNDTTPPTVSLTAPANGATASGTVTVAANATDNVGVAGVQFLLDGANLGAEDTAAPYTLAWDTRTATNASHTLTARARDAAGNTTTSAAVTVTVSNDTTPPTVTITAPANGATASGTVTVTANATDNVAVAGVQFLLDGANLGAEDTAAPYSIAWNTASVANGVHSLAARARDGAGNLTTSAPVTVTVSNDVTAPTVSMTAPAAGATVSGTAVTVSATASDNVGVAGVQFLVDGAASGAEVTVAPYQIAWNSTTVANGSHTLSARARDAAGNQTTSAGVSVTVSNVASTPPVIDAVKSVNRSTNATTLVTGTFSTTQPNELLLAFISADYRTGTNTTVTGIAGAGLTWVLVQRTNVQLGSSEIWRAFAPAKLSLVTVTATLSQSTAGSMTVVSFSNVDTTGTNGSGAVGAAASANSPGGPPTATLVTTRGNSLVFGVGNDFDQAVSRTLGPNQTMVNQYLATIGDTYWVQRTTSPVAASGTTVTINDTAPNADRYNLTICEIKAPQ